MGNKISRFLSLKTPSIIFIVLPYFALHWLELVHSQFYSPLNIFFLVFSIIVLQIFYTFLYTSPKAILQIIATILFVSIILLFYGLTLVDLISKAELANFKHLVIRGRSLLFVFFSSILLIEFYFLNYKRSSGYFQNIFFLILFSIASSTAFSGKSLTININDFKSSITTIKRTDTVNKPIILIITDEYNSPDGLNTYFKDSTLYNFSNHLEKNGWYIKTSFYSTEISTIHSLSSLFNFNLSGDRNYSKMSIGDIGAEKLLKASLYDSLKKKNIALINFGIFDLGDSKPITRLYFYPKSFIDQVLFYSSYPSIIQNTGSFEIKGFQNAYYPMEEHNQKLLNTLPDTIQHIHTNNTFVYAHLYMPHAPMVLNPEFKFKNSSNNNYLAYWKFSNKKIGQLLDAITAKNKAIRIILTGDHGYRGEKKINLHNTFAAFYGFSSADVDSIKSVQDLGSLINGYFK